MIAFWILCGLAGLLAVLAHRTKTFPHRPFVFLALLPALLSIGMLALPSLFGWLVGVDVILLSIVLVDLATLPRANMFSASRETGAIASLLKPHSVVLVLSNHSSAERILGVRDGIPDDLIPDRDHIFITLPARSRANLEYSLRARRRGAFSLSSIHVRVRSRFGFWQRFFTYHVHSRIHVYPDMKQLGEYAVLARKNRLSLLGVRRTRKIGQDNEFERLRDYTVDDNYKHIDWRSTARRNKLTVKDFQTNQSQRIIFLMDCGRMMTPSAGQLSLLDHALNGILMLSFVALGQGDQVGLLCFSNRIHTFIPPRGGMSQMNHLLHACFDRFPQMVESRYDQAFLHLARHCRKRALVVLITNVIDEVNGHQIQRYLGSFSGRHLTLGVLLRDHRLFDAVQSRADDGERLFRAAAAADILAWRHQVLADLETRGVLSLDVFPEDLTAPLVNRYLDIKARHLL